MDFIFLQTCSPASLVQWVAAPAGSRIISSQEVIDLSFTLDNVICQTRLENMCICRWLRVTGTLASTAIATGYNISKTAATVLWWPGETLQRKPNERICHHLTTLSSPPSNTPPPLQTQTTRCRHGSLKMVPTHIPTNSKPNTHFYEPNSSPKTSGLFLFPRRTYNIFYNVFFPFLIIRYWRLIIRYWWFLC